MSKSHCVYDVPCTKFFKSHILHILVPYEIISTSTSCKFQTFQVLVLFIIISKIGKCAMYLYLFILTLTLYLHQ